MYDNVKVQAWLESIQLAYVLNFSSHFLSDYCWYQSCYHCRCRLMNCCCSHPKNFRKKNRSSPLLKISFSVSLQLGEIHCCNNMRYLKVSLMLEWLCFFYCPILSNFYGLCNIILRLARRDTFRNKKTSCILIKLQQSLRAFFMELFNKIQI